LLWDTSFVASSNKESFQVAINAFDQGGRWVLSFRCRASAILVASVRDPKLARLQGAPTFVLLDRGQARDGSKSFDEAAVVAHDKLAALEVAEGDAVRSLTRRGVHFGSSAGVEGG
jgi:hypothetical protein